MSRNSLSHSRRSSCAHPTKSNGARLESESAATKATANSKTTAPTVPDKGSRDAKGAKGGRYRGQANSKAKWHRFQAGFESSNPATRRTHAIKSDGARLESESAATKATANSEATAHRQRTQIPRRPRSGLARDDNPRRIVKGGRYIGKGEFKGRGGSEGKAASFSGRV
jgi:hypothetical protein